MILGQVPKWIWTNIVVVSYGEGTSILSLVSGFEITTLGLQGSSLYNNYTTEASWTNISRGQNVYRQKRPFTLLFSVSHQKEIAWTLTNAMKVVSLR